ncbi:MAG TPA: SDR family oxidoreductase [Solirubrobacteraceae bacterium]|nr:SDR family oxidoreductase [Solirubrobacteraceae bacterium]
MTRDFSQSVVVVTGASSGIGRATALAFADAGARVVLAARRGQALRDVADDCRGRGAEAVAVPTDVRDAATVGRLADEAESRFGGIDVWVNNAGVTLLGRFEDAPADLWREVLETNFFGTVNGARAAVPALRRRGGGVIVNVGSVNSRVGAPYASAYVASKFAVRGFAECLRDELRGEGIDVCTVMPGSIDTPLFQHAANFAGRAIKPLRPVLRPERVAAAIVRCAKRPRREVVVGMSGRQLIAFHDLALPLIERVMTRNVEREHFLQQPAGASAGNLREPVAEWTGVTGGWKQGDARPTGAGPALSAAPEAAG